MKRFVKLVTVTLAATALTGCSYLSSPSHDTHYMSATSVPPLNIPPGISSDKFDNKYPVSHKEYSEKAKDVNVIPPGLYQN